MNHINEPRERTTAAEPLILGEAKGGACQDNSYGHQTDGGSAWAMMRSTLGKGRSAVAEANRQRKSANPARLVGRGRSRRPCSSEEACSTFWWLGENTAEPSGHLFRSRESSKGRAMARKATNAG